MEQIVQLTASNNKYLKGMTSLMHKIRGEKTLHFWIYFTQEFTTKNWSEALTRQREESGGEERGREEEERKTVGLTCLLCLNLEL